MGYILTFCVGGFFGLFIAALASSVGYTEKMQEAYDEGYDIGYKMGLNKNKDCV